jgi:hypothetical protein
MLAIEVELDDVTLSSGDAVWLEDAGHRNLDGCRQGRRAKRKDGRDGLHLNHCE